MIFTLMNSGICKVLNIYDYNGKPLPEEEEAVEIAGSSNEIDRFLRTSKNPDGTYYIPEDRFSWWKHHFAKTQAQRLRLQANAKNYREHDLLRNFYQILKEERAYDGSDHSDNRELKERVLERLRTCYD